MYDYYITPEEYEIAEKNGINERTLTRRVRELGWKKDIAMYKPKQKKTNRRKWVEIALSNGIRKGTFYERVRMGWSEERASTTKIMTKSEVRDAMHKGIRRKYPDWAYEKIKENNISQVDLHNRMRCGWTLEQACTIPIGRGDKRFSQKVSRKPKVTPYMKG